MVVYFEWGKNYFSFNTNKLMQTKAHLHVHMTMYDTNKIRTILNKINNIEGEIIYITLLKTVKPHIFYNSYCKQTKASFFFKSIKNFETHQYPIFRTFLCIHFSVGTNFYEMLINHVSF